MIEAFAPPAIHVPRTIFGFRFFEAATHWAKSTLHLRRANFPWLNNMHIVMRPLSVHPVRCMQLVQKAFNRKLKEATIIQVHEYMPRTRSQIIQNLSAGIFFSSLAVVEIPARQPIVTKSTVAFCVRNFRIEKYNEINKTAPAPKTTNCQWDLHDGGGDDGGSVAFAQMLSKWAFVFAASFQLCRYATLDRTRASMRSRRKQQKPPTIQ